MNEIVSTSPIRIARPTADLDAAERFWCEGVGLQVLWRTEADAEGEHRLTMVGLPGALWHLELVDDPEAAAQSCPGPEDLLVIYLGEPAGPKLLDRIGAAGGRRSAARNPYWERWGVTVTDPDGYLLVLSQRTWQWERGATRQTAARAQDTDAEP